MKKPELKTGDLILLTKCWVYGHFPVADINRCKKCLNNIVKIKGITLSNEGYFLYAMEHNSCFINSYEDKWKKI